MVNLSLRQKNIAWDVSNRVANIVRQTVGNVRVLRVSTIVEFT